MAITETAKIKSLLAPGQRLLGLDIGSKTIGLALSDVLLMLASPAKTIRRSKFTPDAEQLVALINDQNVGGLVLGLPVQMDGSEGRACQSVRQFAENLLGIIDIPIAFWDERLSTVEAGKKLRQSKPKMTHKEKKQLIDSMSAQVILQRYLNYRARLSTGPDISDMEF